MVLCFYHVTTWCIVDNTVVPRTVLESFISRWYCYCTVLYGMVGYVIVAWFGLLDYWSIGYCSIAWYAIALRVYGVAVYKLYYSIVYTE